jgi:hypothetical protein
LSYWSRRIPGVVQEHEVVAWTPENEPVIVDARGTRGWPVEKACP